MWKPFRCNGYYLLYKVKNDKIVVRKPNTNTQVEINRSKAVPPEYNISVHFDKIARELEL